MRTLADLVEHVNTVETNTLTALECIVEKRLPVIAAKGVANQMILESQQKLIDSLLERIVALEQRPPQVVMRGGPDP